MTTAVAVGTRLELDDVRLSYTGAPVVDGLSLTVQPGEILVLTGPSGCGKSTVLRALAGLLRPDSGRVLADGHEVTTTARYCRGAQCGPTSSWRCSCVVNRAPGDSGEPSAGSTKWDSPGSPTICR